MIFTEREVDLILEIMGEWYENDEREALKRKLRALRDLLIEMRE